jgi:hypothetical protein
MNSKFVITAVTCIVVLALSSIVQAAELSANSRAEIQYLLTRLGNSGCQFNRNGSWYSASEARSHLAKKLDYLVTKNLLKTSEDFIERAASTSSVSGKAYQVKCGSANAVDSAVWLGEELARHRQQQGGR